jgi:hypothetical protein
MEDIYFPNTAILLYSGENVIKVIYLALYFYLPLENDARFCIGSELIGP